jgi:hypothetical protein
MKNEMECNGCKEISLEWQSRQTKTVMHDEYKCSTCGRTEVFTSSDVIPESQIILDLKLSIMEAVEIIDNDQFVSRAQNARAILDEALRQHGYPDEDVLAQRRGVV